MIFSRTELVLNGLLVHYRLIVVFCLGWLIAFCLLFTIYMAFVIYVCDFATAARGGIDN